MGDSTTSCMVSGLPIYRRDKVRVLILQPEEGETEAVRNTVTDIGDPDELWKPMVPPLRGTTDDYGCLETFTNDFAARFFTDLCQKEEAAGHMTGDGFESDPDPENEPLFRYLQAMQRGLLVNTRVAFARKNVAWTYSFVREEIWDALICAAYISDEDQTLADGKAAAEAERQEYRDSLDSFVEWYGRTEKALEGYYARERAKGELKTARWAARGYDEEKRNALYSDDNDAYNVLRAEIDAEILAEMGEDSDEHKEQEQVSYRMCRGWGLHCDTLPEPYRFDGGRYYIGSLLNDGRYMDINRTSDIYLWLTDQIEKGTLTVKSPAWKELRDALIDMCLFAKSMRMMEKVYLPCRSRGQDRDWAKYREFALAVAKAADASHEEQTTY